MTRNKITNQNGNVFVYILIAVGLFGALMFALSKSASQTDGASELSEGQAKILAGEIIAYAASTSNAITQMQQTGATVDTIDFLFPSETNFNDPPTIYKLFHPDGGGLNFKALPPKATDRNLAGVVPGYYIGRYNSVEWTPTTTNDIMFTGYKLNQTVCAEINRKLVQDATIPTIVGDTLLNLFIEDVHHAGTNVNFEIANCAACEEIPALCVTDGTSYVFYSILEAQ